MNTTRRHVLRAGGGLLLAGLAPALVTARAAAEVRIEMKGNESGSLVWFEPIGVQVSPGTTVRWLNLDPINSHTATAYHPDNDGKPRRIPDKARPWHSDYLLPNEEFSVTLDVPGVYDYFCVPHELAGMVGRIVVGNVQDADWPHSDIANDGIPEVALMAFPSVTDILASGTVHFDPASGAGHGGHDTK